jgi:hypothetical protein
MFNASRTLRLMCSVAAMLVLGSVVLLSAGWAGAVPPTPAKFWTVSQCQGVLHAQDYLLPTANGHGFHVGERVCVGTGGPPACRWTSDHRSRLHSKFRVFTRSRDFRGTVRAWTLATRGGNGLVGIRYRAGDQYAGWPQDFYMSPGSVRLLARRSTSARFRSIVAPIAARITQQGNAAGCTGG